MARVRRGTLSRERVVEAAVALLDRGGPLTMSAVAAELGAQQMSIYNYVSGKSDLLYAVEDHLLTAIPLPGPGSGTDGLAELLRAYFRLVSAHPWLVGFAIQRERELSTPANLRIVEAAYAVLFRLGLTPRDAVPLFSALVNLVVGAAVQHANLRERGVREKMRAQISALPEAEFPALARLAADLPETSPADAVELGLKALLHGLGTVPDADGGTG